MEEGEFLGVLGVFQRAQSHGAGRPEIRRICRKARSGQGERGSSGCLNATRRNWAKGGAGEVHLGLRRASSERSEPAGEKHRMVKKGHKAAKWSNTHPRAKPNAQNMKKCDLERQERAKREGEKRIRARAIRRQGARVVIQRPPHVGLVPGGEPKPALFQKRRKD